MAVVDQLFAGYGEVSELCPANASSHTTFCKGLGRACRGVSMDRLLKDGRVYWKAERPRLDAIRRVHVSSTDSL